MKHHALHLARALRQGGDSVTVIGPSTVARNTPEVVGFRGVVNVKSNGSDNRLGIFVSPASVWRYFRRNRFDAIHIHEPLQPTLPYWASWFTPSVPKICTFHAFSEHASWSLKAGRQICAPVLLPFVDRAIAVSKPAASGAAASAGDSRTVEIQKMTEQARREMRPGKCSRPGLACLASGPDGWTSRRGCMR